MRKTLFMRKTLSCIAMLAWAGTAHAATTAVEAVFSGDINVPTLTLTNTGDTGEISAITMTVGLAATHGIDGWANAVIPAGVTPTYDPNDFGTSGGGAYDEVAISFTGFGSGLTFSIAFDIDLDNRNTNEDYRTDFLPGGSLLVEFSGGLVNQFLFDLTPSSTGLSSYTYEDSVASAVPLPAGLPLMLTALGGAALMARRKRA